MKYRDTHIFGRPIGALLIVCYKIVWGIFEIFFGGLLMLSNSLITKELIEDPQDLFVTWLLETAHFNVSTAVHAGILFIIFGVVKFFIAAGVWFGSWIMRRYLLVFLCLASAYAAFDLITHFSLFRIFALVSDLAILFYLYRFLPYHLRHRISVLKEVK